MLQENFLFCPFCLALVSTANYFSNNDAVFFYPNVNIRFGSCFFVERFGIAFHGALTLSRLLNSANLSAMPNVI